MGFGSSNVLRAALLIVFGNVIFVVACINLSRAKGQPWYLRLLGLSSCLGLAVLRFVVPDKAGSSQRCTAHAPQLVEGLLEGERMAFSSGAY